MGKFPAITKLLIAVRALGQIIWNALKTAAIFLYQKYQQLRSWLRVRVPFIEALIRRHTHNPATVFIDIAVGILALYVLLGFTGYILVYPKKSETRFTESLSMLYPLPAAKVESGYIWSSKFLQRLRFLNTFTERAETDAKPPTDSELRQQVMAGLIEDRIILLEAQKRGLRVTEDEINKAYEEQQKLTENFEKQIKDLYGMSPQEFKQVIAERILKEKVKAAALLQVRVRHILTATESTANAARRAVESGTSFEDAAKQYSQDTQSKENGGDLGYWSKGELAEQISQGFEDAAFNQEITTLAGPIPSKFGYHIIQIVERNGDQFKTYAEWLKEISTNYPVTVYIPVD